MKTATALAIAALVVLLIACVPIGTIWSLNTLFGLAIPLTWRTCFAALFLAVIVGGNSTRKAA